MITENLVNNYFNDFPIDFFRITPDDFIEDIITARGYSSVEEMESYYRRARQKYTFDTLELDENGFLGNSINEKLDFDEVDTTVINCAVGQGKTTAILKKLKEKYDEDPNSFFIIAVPFVSLIQQYEKDLVNLGISSEDIFNYRNIGTIDIHRVENYRKLLRRVHIITVNTLLGNAGEDAVMQSDAKSDYLKTLSHKLQNGDNKLYFVFDEIHDAIKNFSKIGILHLFYWKGIVKKIIVLSATYNVVSIPVINYLSLFTNNKIKILESERKIVREQSRLFLHFDNSFNYDATNPTLLNIVQNSINRDRTIDIISYSRKLATSISKQDSEIGTLLRDKFSEIRLCVSKEIEEIEPDEDPQNRFDNNFCNVGTNFKSGVSINKENHSFIIILPPRSRRKTYISENGIFTDGINSIIQTLARQRNVGEIHIILPSPIEMDYDSLPEMSEVQKAHFSNAYEQVAIPARSISTRNNVEIKKNEIIAFDEHKKLLRENFFKYISRLTTPIINADSSHIEPPDSEEYIMSNAEKILTLKGFLGRDIACYVVYSAFTNQFYNARLAGFTQPTALDIDNMDDDIRTAFNLLTEAEKSSKISDQYLTLRRKLVDNSRQNFSDTQKRQIKVKIFKFLSNKTELGYKDDSFNYLSKEYNGFQRTGARESNATIIASLDRYMSDLANSISSEGETRYFKNYSENPIFQFRNNEIFELIQLIKSKNPALNLAGAKFFRDLDPDDAGEKLYNYLIRNLYKTKRYQPTIDNERKDYLRIIS